MKNKSKLIALLFVFSSFSSHSAMVVSDPTNLWQNILSYTAATAEYVKQGARWAKTVAQYKSELSNMRKNIEAQTGVRDLKRLISDLDSIKEEYQSFEMPTAAEMKKGSDKFLKEEKADFLNTNLVYDRCTQTDKDAKALCLSARNLGSYSQAEAKKLNEKLMERLESMNDLQESIITADDVKGSMDAANMTAFKQTEMAMFKQQVDLAIYKNKLQKEVNEEKERQLDAAQNKSMRYR